MTGVKKIILLVMLMVISINVVLADDVRDLDNDNKWWEHDFNFMKDYKGEETPVGTSTVGEIIGFLDPLVITIKTIGNTLFFVVTVVLGVKYIWGGVESKASVKDSLTTLVVSALVFYGWSSITEIFMYKEKLSFIHSSLSGSVDSVYSTIMYVCNYLAIGGVVYIGIRYMLAGAEGRAELKAKGVPITLGILMVYGTLTFLNLIVSFI